jgi:hypothetical protein
MKKAAWLFLIATAVLALAPAPASAQAPAPASPPAAQRFFPKADLMTIGAY